MHKHPVSIRWKDTPGLKEADHHFEKINGKTGGDRCKVLVEKFVEQSKIFADPAFRGKGTTLKTTVTIDAKEVKFVDGTDVRRPLTLLKVNGVALMLCRPDQEKVVGLLFKLCPHDGVPLSSRDQIDSEISKFNRSLPRSLQLQSELALAS